MKTEWTPEGYMRCDMYPPLEMWGMMPDKDPMEKLQMQREMPECYEVEGYES